MALMDAKAERGKGPVIFSPDCALPNKVSPQTLAWARYFAEKGYVSILTGYGRIKKRRLFKKKADHVFLYRGDQAALGKLSNPVLWTNRKNIDDVRGLAPNAMVLYRWKEAERPADGEATRQHERALDDAALVLCDTEVVYRRAVADRPDAVLVSDDGNAVRERQFAPPQAVDNSEQMEERWVACDIAEELWKQKRFQKYLHRGNRRFFRAMCRRYAQDHESSPCLNFYFEYAISSNDRGRAIADLLARYTSIAGKRYLDAGCAYAGFLVAMAERGAAETVGIDVDPRLLLLRRRTCRTRDCK